MKKKKLIKQQKKAANDKSASLQRLRRSLHDAEARAANAEVLTKEAQSRANEAESRALVLQRQLEISKKRYVNTCMIMYDLFSSKEETLIA